MALKILYQDHEKAYQNPGDITSKPWRYYIKTLKILHQNPGDITSKSLEILHQNPGDITSKS